MQNRKLSADDFGILLLMAAILFGVWFRFFPPYSAGFPINDGGLFYKMIEAIQANGFRLPAYVHYNGLDIPFAYPPLGFYIAGVIAAVFHATLLNTLLWLPAIVLTAIIPAFYYLANLILKSRWKAGLATFLYVLLPRSITWLIMGGGVTRSWGQLFLILATANLYLLYTNRERKYLAWSIVFCSLVCLTHPEASIHTAGIALLLWIFYGRNKHGMVATLIVAAGTLVITSPWWVTILRRFGAAPFLSATSTGLNDLGYVFRVFQPFSGELFVAVIFCLSVLGIVVKIVKRDYFLPIWFILPFLLEPRNAPNVSILPLAMLASVALTDLLLPALSKIESATRNLEIQQPLQSRIEKILLGSLILYTLIGMQSFAQDLKENSLTRETREAFGWIDIHAPANARFLIITGKTDLFADPVNEWFPTLTNRRSLTTIQGYEWMGHGEFAKLTTILQEIQDCPIASNALACVDTKVKEAGLDYEYLLIVRTLAGKTLGENLMIQLEGNEQYESVFKTDSVTIFKKK
jgi:hypothetical protein